MTIQEALEWCDDFTKDGFFCECFAGKKAKELCYDNCAIHYLIKYIKNNSLDIEVKPLNTQNKYGLGAYGDCPECDAEVTE